MNSLFILSVSSAVLFLLCVAPIHFAFLRVGCTKKNAFRLIGFQTVLKRPPTVFGNLARKAIPDGLMTDTVARPISWQLFLAWAEAVAMPSSAPPLPSGVTVVEESLVEGLITGRRSCQLAGDKAPCFLELRGTLRLAETITPKDRKDRKFVLTDFCALREVR